MIMTTGARHHLHQLGRGAEEVVELLCASQIPLFFCSAHKEI
jgi:hypothetical protein